MPDVQTIAVTAQQLTDLRGGATITLEGGYTIHGELLDEDNFTAMVDTSEQGGCMLQSGGVWICLVHDVEAEGAGETGATALERHSHLVAAAGVYVPRVGPLPNPDQRWLAVEFRDGSYQLWTYETKDEALESFYGDDPSWHPHALVDLDTGRTSALRVKVCVMGEEY